MTEPSPRPGRIRRWVLRPLAWSTAIVALLLFTADRATETSWFRDRVRTEITEQLGLALDRNVTLRGLELSLLPLRIEIEGLVVEDLEPDLEPLLEVPWAAIEGDLASLGRRRIHLRDVQVERPRLSLRFWDDSSNLPLYESQQPSGHRPFEIWIDQVSILEAQGDLDHQPAEFALRALGIHARFRGVGESRLQGDVRSEEVRLRLPGASAPLDVAVTGALEIGRDGVDYRDFHITHDRLDTRVDGRCAWSTGELYCRFEHKGTVDGPLGSDLGWVDGLEGTIDATGTFEWRPAMYGWRATVTGNRLRFADTDLRDLRGQIALDRFGARFRLDQIDWCGGRIQGLGEVDLRDDHLPVTLDLEVDGATIDEILAERDIELGNVATRVGGNVRYRFPGRKPLQGDGSLDLVLRSDPGLPGLPFRGDLSARIEKGRIVTDAGTLRSEQQAILVRGSWDLPTGQAEILWEGTTLAAQELVELIPGDPDDRWRPSSGTGTFHGILNLDGPQARSEVRLDLEHVVTSHLDADRVVGGFSVSPESLEDLRLEIARDDEALVVSGRVPWDDSGVDLAVDLVDVSIESMRPWIPFDVPIEGRSSGRVELSITGDEVSGHLTTTLAAPRVAGVDVDSLAGRIRWTPELVELDEVTLLTPAGMIVAHGVLGLTDEADVDVSIDAQGLRVGESPLSEWLGPTELEGRLDLEVDVRGSRGSPLLSLNAGLHELTSGGEVLGSGTGELDATWSAGRLDATAELLDRISMSGGGDLPLEAVSGTLEPPGPDLTFALRAHDLASLHPVLPEEVPVFDGELNGEIFIGGETAESWSTQVRLDHLHLSHDLDHESGLALQNLEPVELFLSTTGFRIVSLWLGEPGGTSEIFAIGTGGFQADAPLDLRLQGAVDGAWFDLLRDDVLVQGRVELLGRLFGTPSAPVFDGQGGFRDARVDLTEEDFPHAFEDVQGLVLFSPRAIVVDHLRGAFAGGRTSVEGSLDPQTSDFSFRIAGRNLQIRALDGWAFDGDLDLAVRPLAERGGTIVTGSADLRRLQYLEDIPANLSQLFSSFLRRQRLEAGAADSPLADIHLNLAIKGKNAVRVRNNISDLRGSADLVLRGTLAQPILFGRVDLEEGGEIVYNDTEYELRRGRITFADPRRIDPEVDLVATTEVREFAVRLNLSGTMERLQASFSSEPPLPDLEVFRLLATGEVGDGDREHQKDASTSAASFLYGQAANVIGERVGSLFGFDQFRIDPLTGGGDSLSSARLTIGKRISRDLYVTYSADPSSTEEHRLRVEWKLGESMILVLTQNGDGTYEADARWESRF